MLVADASEARATRARDAFAADILSVDEIHRADVDVFAPCALGGGLSRDTILELNTKIICGAANNQLQHDSDGEMLRELGILYCPDYVVNAGGIINATAEMQGDPKDVVEGRVRAIADRLHAIIREAEIKRIATNAIADEHARMRLAT